MPHSQSHSYTVLVRCDVQLTLPQAHSVFVGFGTDAVGGWDKKVKQILPAWILIDASFFGLSGIFSGPHRPGCSGAGLATQEALTFP